MRNTRVWLPVLLIMLLLSLGSAGWLWWERSSLLSENATATAEYDTLKDQITKADQVQDTNRQLQDQIEDLQEQLREAQRGEPGAERAPTLEALPTPEGGTAPPPESAPGPTPETGTEPAPTPGGSAPPDDILALMGTIEQQVIELRQLPELRPVERRFMTRDELRAYIESEMAEENEPQELQNSATELWLLGLGPRDLDLEQLFIDLQTEQIAGFYDPEADTFYLIGENPELAPIDQITYAHEFTHNLQDQLVDLNEGLTIDEFDTDRSLAYRSIVEGDASLSMQYWMQQYLLKAMTPEQIQEMFQDLQATEQDSTTLNNAPRIIRDQLIFPYEQGLFFAQELYDLGGWQAINQALQDPPRSTEQILHPEKYLATPRENPNLPERFDLSAALDGQWTTATTATLGEFDLRILLEEVRAPGDTDAAAAGIDGIRYALYTQAATDTPLLQMTLRWDTPEDGAEFLAAYQAAFKPAGDLLRRQDIYMGVKGTGQEYTILYSPDETVVRAARAVQP